MKPATLMVSVVVLVWTGVLAACTDHAGTGEAVSTSEQGNTERTVDAGLTVVNASSRALRVEWGRPSGDGGREEMSASMDPCDARTVSLGDEVDLLVVSFPSRVLYAGVDSSAVPQSLTVSADGRVSLSTGTLPKTCKRAEPLTGSGGPLRTLEVINGSNRRVEVEWWPYPDGATVGHVTVSRCTVDRISIRTPVGRYTMGVSSPDGPVQFGWGVPAGDEPISGVTITADGGVSPGTFARSAGCAGARS